MKNLIREIIVALIGVLFCLLGIYCLEKYDCLGNFLSENYVVILIIILLISITIVICIIKIDNLGRSGKLLLHFGKKGKILIEEIDTYEEEFYNGDIYRIYWIISNYIGLSESKFGFLSAILLKWLKQKQIRIESNTKGDIFRKEETTIIFETSIPNLDTQLENDLYKYMYKASKNGVLESKKFEKWCCTNYSKILDWFDKILDYENEILIQEGKLIKNKKTVLGFTFYRVDSSMYEEATQIRNLKKILENIENIPITNIDALRCDEYIMYAEILGIVDKTTISLKKLYPKVINDYKFKCIEFINSIVLTGLY